MPELPRNLPHLYLRARAKAEPYATKLKARSSAPPQRDRAAHSQLLQASLTSALAQVGVQRAQRELPDPPLKTGFYLDFEIAPGSEKEVALLENRSKQIELVSVRQETETTPTIATVFIPDAVEDHFLSKIAAYGTENTAKGKPKNQNLVARVQNRTLAELRSIYTDDPAQFPVPGQSIWWEIWIRKEHLDAIDAVLRRLGIPTQQQWLHFPDRDVRLVYGDALALTRLFLNSAAIAEVRCAQDTPGLFLDWTNVEQAEWAADLAWRLVGPGDQDLAICLLDTGVTSAHPLLTPGIHPGGLYSFDPAWPGGDARGHGTNMAGTILYGDLTPLLVGTGPVSLTHRLESVKILPDQGENEPKLYGAITVESVAMAESNAPNRRRAVCMAITGVLGTNRGRPSSWSAAIDQLCFSDQKATRLILLAAGNVREGISKAAYPFRNEIESIENPAQAWNAITVGAFTEKTTIADQTFAGWEPIAPLGELCPTSRTSLLWERDWPNKPDIVLEGGNWASSGDICDCPPDLSILTTHKDPTTRHFDSFGDTSAATAMAANLAGKIMALVPDRWPETIRAMIVHSAEWTAAMKERFDGAKSKQQKRTLLRKYGYGVPNYERAVLSAANDLTLIVEDELQPFWKDGIIKTRHMNLHQFPWPRKELEQLGEMEVELRLTLSYYVEPNPGERGRARRHRYPSHGLRFEIKRALESVSDFRTRINAAVSAEEEGKVQTSAGPDHWLLGRIRNVGSIHSDYWRGPAAELAQKSAVGIYPVGGWWKENPAHQRYDRKVRYALLVSIRAVNATVDIYTPVQVQIANPIEVTT